MKLVTALVISLQLISTSAVPLPQGDAPGPSPASAPAPSNNNNYNAPTPSPDMITYSPVNDDSADDDSWRNDDSASSPATAPAPAPFVAPPNGYNPNPGAPTSPDMMTDDSAGDDSAGDDSWRDDSATSPATAPAPVPMMPWDPTVDEGFDFNHCLDFKADGDDQNTPTCTPVESTQVSERTSSELTMPLRNNLCSENDLCSEANDGTLGDRRSVRSSPSRVAPGGTCLAWSQSYSRPSMTLRA